MMNQMGNRPMFDMNNDRNSRRTKKNSPKSIAIAVAVLLLLQIFSAAEGAMVRSNIMIILVPVLAMAIFFFVFGVIAKKAVKAKAEEKPSRTKSDGYCKTCSDDFVYNNRQTEYNENSAEQNFNRDKQRRIRQLDDFLKNGLIDKNEYMVLRARYEKQ